MRDNLKPSDKLRVLAIGMTEDAAMTLTKATVDGLLAEIRVLRAGQLLPEELRAEVQAEAAAFAERTVRDRTATAAAILELAVARHRAGLRLLGITILFWLVGTLALIGSWL